MLATLKIAIIGAGAMGGAVAHGLLRSRHPSQDISIANPHAEKLREFAQAGCRVTSDNVEAIRGASVIIIAVKPWVLPQVAQQLRAHIDVARQEVAVIAAGVSGAELTGMFSAGGAVPSLAIVMPNTAVSIGRSVTFAVDVVPENVLIQVVFKRLGSYYSITESTLPAATALASCGIAYAMRYIRAAMEGGVELGFRAADAQQIIVQTVRGAAELLMTPGAHPESEIDKVTTPGGITIRGLNAMEEAGFTPAVIAGLRASIKK